MATPSNPCRRRWLSVLLLATGLTALSGEADRCRAVWEVVGSAGFPGCEIHSLSLASHEDGPPFVSYTSLYSLKVATYDPGLQAWSPVGGDIATYHMTTEASLTFDLGGSPWVAVDDVFQYVYQYSGSSWVAIGNPISGDRNLRISIDEYNIPHLAYEKWVSGDYFLAVRRLEGQWWRLVGSSSINTDPVEYPCLATGQALYVAFRDNGQGGAVTVMMFNGVDWIPVGTPGFSAGGAQFVSLALDSKDVAYVAYQDQANGDRVTVMRYYGPGWAAVGSIGFSPGGARYISLVIDDEDRPLVAFRDQANSSRATVMRFDGMVWSTVGSAGFSPGLILDTSLAICGGGMPHLAFKDHTVGGSLTVMRYDPSAIPSPTPTMPPPLPVTSASGLLLLLVLMAMTLTGKKSAGSGNPLPPPAVD